MEDKRYEKMENRQKRKDAHDDGDLMDDRILCAQFRIAEFISELDMSARQFPFTLRVVYIIYPDEPVIDLGHYSNESFCEML